MRRSIGGDQRPSMPRSRVNPITFGKGLLHRNWLADSDRRRRHLYDGYAVQEAGLKRRSTISHPRVEPHDLASFGAASV